MPCLNWQTGVQVQDGIDISGWRYRIRLQRGFQSSQFIIYPKCKRLETVKVTNFFTKKEDPGNLRFPGQLDISIWITDHTRLRRTRPERGFSRIVTNPLFEIDDLRNAITFANRPAQR